MLTALIILVVFCAACFGIGMAAGNIVTGKWDIAEIERLRAVPAKPNPVQQAHANGHPGT